jgi:hypothetical protein
MNAHGAMHFPTSDSGIVALCRLIVTDPDNFPEARFWPTSELPTIHERRIGIFGCVSHQLSAFVRSIGFKDCPSYPTECQHVRPTWRCSS